MKKKLCKECVRLHAEAERWEKDFAEADAEAEVLADELEGANKRIALLEGDLADVGSWFQHQQKVALDRYHRIKELEKELTQLQVDSL
jgi:chromosome segregation ATPase